MQADSNDAKNGGRKSRWTVPLMQMSSQAHSKENDNLI